MEDKVTAIVARNIKLARIAAGMTSRRQLAQRAKVSENTIKNLEEPDQRLPGASRSAPSPRLSILEKVAKGLDQPIWALMHEDFNPAIKAPERIPSNAEMEFYKTIEAAYDKLKNTGIAD